LLLFAFVVVVVLL